MALACTKFGKTGGRIRRDGEYEIVNKRLFAPIALVGLEADCSIFLIGNEGERARSNRNLVELLRLACLQKGIGVFGRTNRGKVHRQIGEDRHIRLVELHDDRGIVGFFNRGEQSRHIHVVEIIVFAAGYLRVRMIFLPLAIERPHHVIGVEITARLEIIHARMELHTLAELEGDRLAFV